MYRPSRVSTRITYSLSSVYKIKEGPTTVIKKQKTRRRKSQIYSFLRPSSKRKPYCLSWMDRKVSTKTGGQHAFKTTWSQLRFQAHRTPFAATRPSIHPLQPPHSQTITRAPRNRRTRSTKKKDIGPICLAAGTTQWCPPW